MEEGSLWIRMGGLLQDGFVSGNLGTGRLGDSRLDGFAKSMLIKWCPRPDLNRDKRFRKPLLYPVELRGQLILIQRLTTEQNYRNKRFVTHFCNLMVLA